MQKERNRALVVALALLVHAASALIATQGSSTPFRTGGLRSSSVRAMVASPSGTDALRSAAASAQFLVQHTLAQAGAAWRGSQHAQGEDASLRIVKLCDSLDVARARVVELRREDGEPAVLAAAAREADALAAEQWWALASLLQRDGDAYVQTASFLRDRIPRETLPSVLGVSAPTPDVAAGEPAEALTDDVVAPCALPNVTYTENLLDRALLFIFRKLVQKQIGWASPEHGFEGLVAEGRHYMLRATDAEQQRMVYNALSWLLTPAMPLIYKPFMSGVFGNRTYGPWIYAPLLTAVVTPPFFNFLVGPSTPNLRRDGLPGGLLVQKCRFLQQSNCKGICMQMCKLPAQQFFQDGLGMPLTVTPIFETQECQWNFGEVPLPPEEDPLLPKGCISECTTRAAMAEARVTRAKPCL